MKLMPRPRARNYQAEMNKLKSQTRNYYTLKEVENQVQISKDNLALKEKLLSNTQLKYRLGTVSKSNLLQAETSMNEAKDQLIVAQMHLMLQEWDSINLWDIT